MWSYNHTFSYSYSPALFHYGIKGMKWGVRRTPEELGYNKGSVESVVNRHLPKVIAKNGLKVRSMSIHAAEQAEERKVKAKEILETLNNPLYIYGIRTDEQGRRSQRLVGNNATVNVNPDNGVIVTV